MKTKYLLPGRFRVLGWILVAIFAPLGIWYLFFGESFPLQWEITIPWPFEENNSLQGPGDNLRHLNIIDEILALGAIAGFFIVGFTKQLVEDERVALLRLEALQWGIYANYLIMAICIVFIHDSYFLTVMIYNIFTPLLIFVARFYWLLYVNPAIEAKRERSLV